MEATDGISEEARLKGAGIAPLHPHAQWDKDHPQKKQSTIKSDTMKDTVLDSNFRIMMLKMGYTENDIEGLYIMYGGNHAGI